MAYISRNLVLIGGEIHNPDRPRIWAYQSADAIATARAINYISDAKYRGMKPYDVVLVVDSATPTLSWCSVIAVAETGADLSDGTAISVTNT